MDPIEAVLAESSRERQVKRRAAGSRVSGRWVPGAETDARVKLTIQPGSGTKATDLARALAGDSTQGEIRVWASLTDLAAAYDAGDPGTPLLWDSLNVAQPEESGSGVPGDRVIFDGREYEVTRESIWDDGGLVPASNFRAYIAVERKAAT